jgi:hypothetical protein
MIIEFLSNFGSRQDAARVVVSPMEGGVVIGVE